jgi:hypothetical protein
MKKTLKLPTIIGIFILILGIVSGVFLINSNQTFKIGADVDVVPNDIKVTNITDSQATITWVTAKESSGFVKWGTSQGSLSKVALNETNEKSLVHSINILGIEAGKQVFFKINSGGKDFDNNGTPWLFNTLGSPIVSGNLPVASGTILNETNSTPAKALVYITINGKTVSSLTSSQGNFVIPLAQYLENVSETQIAEINAVSELNNSTSAVAKVSLLKAIPVMVIGKTYDFRNIETTDNQNLPQSSLSVPEAIEKSSRFEITKSPSQTQETTVTVESIEDGEIITTTDPEFFGTGPKNLDLEVTIESELQSATVSTNSQGKWIWSPPNNLEPGEHKLTLKWTDTAGIVRTITRSFIVQAAEGPAFVSTPSATPINSASPPATTKASTTPVASQSASSSPKSTPETGSLTPTIGLFMFGISVLFGSLFVFKKINVN